MTPNIKIHQAVLEELHPQNFLTGRTDTCHHHIPPLHRRNEKNTIALEQEDHLEKSKSKYTA